MHRRWLLHLAFWGAYWIVFSYTYSRYDGNLGKYLVTEGLQMPMRMLATYMAFWCIDHLRTSWGAFSGIVAAVFCGALLTRVLKMVYLVPVWFSDATFEFWSHRMMIDAFDCALAAGVALTARLYFRQQDLLRREAALRAEKSEAELKFLKNQLHPHFLFNTINNLYALARIKSDKTAPVALQLAQLLRYVLYESVGQNVRIEQEVNHILAYIALEKLRFDEERLSIKTTIEMDDPAQPVTPLLLLPLVENAFKHGAGEVPDDAWVHIHILLKNKCLEVKIDNATIPNHTENSNGIGLSNLKRQLELLYPVSSKLNIHQTDTTFSIHLQIWNL